jgi:hypothetical protein
MAEIDTASLAVTRRIDLSAHPCPSTLALGGTPEPRGTIDGEEWRMDYLRDLALTSDGTTLFSAADAHQIMVE